MVDTREQLPYCDSDPPFGRNVPTAWITAALWAGDYSLQGHERPGPARSDGIAIERKRPIELFDCFTTDRDRFRREFERLAGYRFAAVVIEGTIEDVGTLYATWVAEGEVRYGRVSPAAVVNSLISWSMRYGVHIVFAGRTGDPRRSRALAQAYTYRALEKFAGMMAREREEQREEMREEQPQAGAADAAGTGRQERAGAIPGLVTQPVVTHIRAMHGAPFVCLRCRESYDPGERVPIGAWNAIASWFHTCHALCLPLGPRLPE